MARNGSVLCGLLADRWWLGWRKSFVEFCSGLGDVAVQLTTYRFGFAQVAFGEILGFEPDPSPLALCVSHKSVRLFDGFLNDVVIRDQPF